MFNLSATNTIAGYATSATSVTITINGCELNAGLETYKVLAQQQLANSVGTIYTAPSSTSTFVKTIVFQNTTNSTQTIYLYINGTTSAYQVLQANVPLYATATFDTSGFRVTDQNGYLLTGTSGFSGFSGNSGYSGYSGNSGYSGYIGNSGYSGYSGTLGNSGYSGYSGNSGYSGYSGVSLSTSTAHTWTAIQLYNSGGTIEEGVYANGNSSTSFALNLDNGNLQSITITGAVAITQTTPTHTGKYTIIITQNATGYVYSLSGIKWAGGTAPTYSTTANKIDVISIAYDGTNYYGSGNVAFA